MRDCEDCGISVGDENFDMVVLPYSTWKSIAKRKDLLCCSCIEKRLGRNLTLDDFPDKGVPSYTSWQIDNIRRIWVNMEYFHKKGWSLRNN
jgi:hypothetical protein